MAKELIMDCLKFANWLENRDTYDLSEADKAIKHAADCPTCNKKLVFDEKLDSIIRDALKRVKTPANLNSRVDLSLAGLKEKKSKTRYGVFGAFSAVMAVMVVFAIGFLLNPTDPSLAEMGDYIMYDHGHHDASVSVVNNTEGLHRLGVRHDVYGKLMERLPAGYSFVGARVCPLGECQAVHLMYSGSGKKISVYMIKTEDVDFTLSSGKTYTVDSGNQSVQFWRDGNFIIAMTG